MPDNDDDDNNHHNHHNNDDNDDNDDDHRDHNDDHTSGTFGDQIPNEYVIAFEGNTITNQVGGATVRRRFTSAYNSESVLRTLVDVDFSVCVAECDVSFDCRGIFVAHASRFTQCTLLRDFGAAAGVQTDLDSYSLIRLNLDCAFSSWTPWSGCDCPGTQSRTRSVVRQPTPGGVNCQTLGSFKEDRECSLEGVDCEAVFYGNCEAIRCAACAEGEFALRPCERYANTVCQGVSPPCRNGAEYQVRGPTATTDRVCQEVRGPCEADEYEVEAPTPSSDRVCKPVTTTTPETTTTTTVPLPIDSKRYIFGRVQEADGADTVRAAVGATVRAQAGEATLGTVQTGPGGLFSLEVSGALKYTLFVDGGARLEVAFREDEERRLVSVWRPKAQATGTLTFLVLWDECPADIDGHLVVPWSSRPVAWDQKVSAGPGGVVARTAHTSEAAFSYEMFTVSGVEQLTGCTEFQFYTRIYSNCAGYRKSGVTVQVYRDNNFLSQATVDPRGSYDRPDPCPDLSTSGTCPRQCELKCSYSRIFNAFTLAVSEGGADVKVSTVGTVTAVPEFGQPTCP